MQTIGHKKKFKNILWNVTAKSVKKKKSIITWIYRKKKCRNESNIYTNLRNTNIKWEVLIIKRYIFSYVLPPTRSPIPSRCVHFHVSTSFFPSGTLAPLQNLKAFCFINILWWHLGWTKQHGLNLLSGSDLPDCLCPLVSTPLLHPGRLTASTVNMFFNKDTRCYRNENTHTAIEF